jgi:hypothetical protein
VYRPNSPGHVPRLRHPSDERRARHGRPSRSFRSRNQRPSFGRFTSSFNYLNLLLPALWLTIITNSTFLLLLLLLPSTNIFPESSSYHSVQTIRHQLHSLLFSLYPVAQYPITQPSRPDDETGDGDESGADELGQVDRCRVCCARTGEVGESALAGVRKPSITPESVFSFI